MFEYDEADYFAGIPFAARQVPRKLAWLLGRGQIRELLKGVYSGFWMLVLERPTYRFAWMGLAGSIGWIWVIRIGRWMGSGSGWSMTATSGTRRRNSSCATRPGVLSWMLLAGT
ncbi:hypothetical protein [Kribbella sp. NBC_00889]|uniref:hypothetical protein n=1 Tax=Kribbella sp. NBC_00889 TaxID=2975974 RepID=UPI003866F17E|nr:hypothetical protein OG817_09445 [Kribbella sp. NBC_00889]